MVFLGVVERTWSEEAWKALALAALRRPFIRSAAFALRDLARAALSGTGLPVARGGTAGDAVVERRGGDAVEVGDASWV